MLPPDMPSNSVIHAFAVGVQQVFDDIQNNSDARPGFWCETVATAANQYCPARRNIQLGNAI
jgi:hypothetical protein